MAFPAGFKRGDVHDQAATRIGAFAKADDQHIFGDAEIFGRVGKGEAVWGDDAYIGFAVNEALVREVFRVNHGVVDICKNLEILGAAGVVSIGG